TTALYSRMILRASVEDLDPTGGAPSKSFHHRWNYRFKRPVHEALFFSGESEVARNCDGVVMYHVQDHSKPTRRQYLPLMELAHKEDPKDAQICFWLGREYMWADRPEQACELLQRYLALPTSIWGDERAEAMRYLARMLPEKRLSWLEKARNEAPHRREIWLDLAEEFHHYEDWPNLFWACTNGIDKTWRTGSYLDDENCWSYRLFDLGAIACWHLNVMDRAVDWGRQALEFEPGNERLRTNLDFFIRRRDEVRAGA
ncbi:MAG: hypothetical protein WBF73_26510, partial [Bradyrhizobium sp.]